MKTVFFGVWKFGTFLRVHYFYLAFFVWKTSLRAIENFYPKLKQMNHHTQAKLVNTNARTKMQLEMPVEFDTNLDAVKLSKNYWAQMHKFSWSEKLILNLGHWFHDLFTREILIWFEDHSLAHLKCSFDDCSKI